MEQEEEKSALFWSTGKGRRKRERNGRERRERGGERMDDRSAFIL